MPPNEEKVRIDVVELDYKDGDGVPVAGMTKLDMPHGITISITSFNGDGVPVLCVAINVACNIRGGYFKGFEGGLLQCISEVTYEDDIKKVPSSPDISNCLISEDEPSAVNGNKDSLRFDGMADNEVERRLKCNRFDRMADNEIERRLKEALLTSFPSQMKNAVLMIKYVNDGRPFWQHIVSSSTGCSDSRYFDELYNYYTTEKAWRLSDPDAEKAAWHLCDSDAEKVFKALRAAGAKLAVVSNFDTQLRPVLRALNCDHWFDAVAVSAEIAVLPTMLDLLFTEATKHKDGGPLDKESSNTIEILQIGRADILSGDIILPAQRRWVEMGSRAGALKQMLLDILEDTHEIRHIYNREKLCT
ncbi:putative IAA-amino acid hydrolase ILR1-like 6-like [Capsicum annuum]|nr:putative IAA-amino acid hydrolase ILR1-like 6-like [Capsicum annuum]